MLNLVYVFKKMPFLCLTLPALVKVHYICDSFFPPFGLKILEGRARGTLVTWLLGHNEKLKAILLLVTVNPRLATYNNTHRP